MVDVIERWCVHALGERMMMVLNFNSIYSKPSRGGGGGWKRGGRKNKAGRKTKVVG
jgi:hypothetical protein